MSRNANCCVHTYNKITGYYVALQYSPVSNCCVHTYNKVTVYYVALQYSPVSWIFYQLKAFVICLLIFCMHMEGKKKDACSIQHKKYKEHQKA